MALKNTSQKYNYTDKLSFLGEWFDHEAAFHKNFIINFYPFDNTVELFDKDLNRMYLKRASCDGVTVEDLFVGNIVRIYGRQINILDYADCKTRQFVGKTKEHTFGLIKPGAINKLGEIIARIEASQFLITRMRMAQLSRKEALSFYEHRKGDQYLSFMIEHIVSGRVVAMELVGDDGINRWRNLIGPTDPMEARKTNPDSLRALYGQETSSNGFHGALNKEEAVQGACFFFPQGIKDKKPPPNPLELNKSTCCIVKPHAIHEKKLGMIIDDIQKNKFKITAMVMTYLNNPNADEFLEVYKGVVADYNALLLSFLDGPCVVMEISGTDDCKDVHGEFRQLCGPHDSDIARQIRPNTLRAKFGVDKYKNAVHCTDLPEDTVLELEYMFKIVED